MVTELQKEKIRILRLQGFGYREISRCLELTRDEVRYCCKKMNLAGYREIVIHSEEETKPEDIVCKNCGADLEPPATGRRRHFCSEICRRKWWSQNRDKIRKGPDAIYGFTCKCCGKEFTAYGNPHRQYCSHECYISDRFWDGEKPTETKKIDWENAVPVVILVSEN